jgi:hypothetical protein
MSDKKKHEITYVRRSADELRQEAQGQAPSTWAEAPRTATGGSAATASEQRWVQALETEVTRHERARAAARLDLFRPVMVEEFGEELTERVLGHRYGVEFVIRMEDAGVEADVAVARAAEYLREHPSGTVADAFHAAQGLEG